MPSRETSSRGKQARRLAAFRDAQAWRASAATAAPPVEALWSFQLPVAPEALWPYIIETSRLNRALGLSRMQLEEVKGRLAGRTRYAGFSQAWEEVPWDWVEARTLTSLRRYTRGFAHAALGAFELEPLGDQTTRLWVYFGFAPRGAFGRLMLRLGLGRLARAYRRAIEAIAARVGEDIRRIEGFSVPAPPLAPEAQARLRELRSPLLAAGASARAVDALLEYVARGDETDLYRIQIRPLARAWELDEDELLLACLHATRAGLLELSWDVICPHCRGVRQTARSLGHLPARDACDACGIDFATNSEQSLEITFNVHPSIREVARVYYCSAEPSTKLHIKLKQRLVGGERREVDTRLPPGRYRLRVEGERCYRYLDVASGGPATVRWPTEDTTTAGPSPRIVLENPGDADATYVVESIAWSDDALRPARLFNLQAFRDLFSEEYLATDIQLEVGEQTILFTDIVGSTRFYGTHGDPHAFMVVKRHFAELYEEIAGHHGAVVKTIGDAAMAAFASPLDAVAAAAAIQSRFHPARADTEVRLRASINTGPCIAVNLNSGIDYFGNTVNVAAKLQACAGAGEIAIARAVYDAPGVRERLADTALARRELDHPAFDGPVEAFTWRVTDAGQRRDARAG